MGKEREGGTRRDGKNRNMSEPVDDGLSNIKEMD
jgi:hypothetical protein